MKIIFFLIILQFLIFGCAHNEKKVEAEMKEVKVAEQKIDTPLITTQNMENTPSIEFSFQKDLNDFWKKYFTEDYNDSRSINVMVFTNRIHRAKGFGCTDDHFGITSDLNFRVGVCRINVPRNHGTGELKFSKDQRDSSHDYFKILGQKELNLNYLLDYIKKTKRSPMIFVHGFNVKHEQAILRAAQIAYDLKYQGPVILFSWPAGAGDNFFDNKLIKKTYDDNLKNAQNSIPTFKLFISKLIENKIIPNIVVHSMGHQVVLPALFELGRELPIVSEPNAVTIAPVGELILNAPDFDSDTFARNVELIKNLSKRITLYCSFNDKAMTASESVNSSKRLGACTYTEGVDTINVSLLDNSTFSLGHGYYATRPILTDVFQVLLGIEADRRLFMRKSDPNSTEKYYLRQ